MGLNWVATGMEICYFLFQNLQVFFRVSLCHKETDYYQFGLIVKKRVWGLHWYAYAILGKKFSINWCPVTWRMCPPPPLFSSKLPHHCDLALKLTYFEPETLWDKYNLLVEFEGKSASSCLTAWRAIWTSNRVSFGTVTFNTHRANAMLFLK